MLNLQAMQMAENRRNLKTTVLYRPNGTWSHEEVSLLTHELRTEVSGHPAHPEHLIISGHHTKEQTLGALVFATPYVATEMTGVDKLPYVPGFI